MAGKPTYEELEKRVHDLERTVSEYKRKEEARKKADKGFRFLSENTSDLIYRYAFKPYMHFEFVSPSVFSITGYTPEEHYDDPMLGLKLVHPDDRHIIEKLLDGTIGQGVAATIRWIKKDGTVIWTEQRNTPRLDEEGELCAIEGIARDITEQKQIEETLKKSEESARALLNATTESAFLMEPDGTFVDMNEIAATRLGKNADELIGKTAYDLIPSDVAQSRKRILKKTVKQKEPIRFEDTRNGICFDHNVYPILDSEGQVYRLAVFAKDITDRKKIQNELNLKSRIANVLLTSDGTGVYSEILYMVLEDLKSEYGYFGYIDDKGDLVCPSMTYDVWDQCLITEKDIVFPKSDWGGLWGRSLLEKKLLVSNHALNPLSGHVPLRRALVCPIIQDSELIGQISVANKPSDYTDDDVDKIESIADYIAPILKVRLEKEKDLQRRKKAEKQLREKDRFLSSVLDSIQDGISVLSPDLKIRHTNRTMQTWYSGHLPLENKYCFEVYRGHQKPCDDCPTLRSISSRKLEMQEVPLVQNDRKSGVLEVYAFPMFDDGNNLSGVVEYIRDISSRKQAEDALRENEKRYRSLFKNHHSVMLIIDPSSGDIVDANPAAVSYYGWSHEEITCKNISNINTLTKEQIFMEMEKAKQEQRRIFYFQHRLSDGDIRDVEVYSGPIQLHGKDFLFSIIHDISERKQAEKSLQESERRLDAFYNASFEGIAITVKGKIIDCNRQFADIIGYGVDELIGKEVIELVPEEDQDLVFENIRSGYDKPYEHKATKKDGSVIYIEVHGQQIQFKGRQARVTAIRDLTEKITTEKALQDSERNMASVLNNTQDAVVRIDRGHRHIFANPSLYAGTGLSPEQYLGKTNEEIGMPEDLCAFWREKHDKVFQGGEPEIFEFSFSTANKGERVFQAVVSPEFDQNDEVETIVSFMRDITEIKKAESERNAVIEELEQALAEIKTLRGFIPICANCKNIRDDEGYWQQIEEYIRDRSDAQFSHTICPECAKKLYPELDLEKIDPTQD